MTGLPPEYLDRATPADVDVTDRVRTRYPDPTLGVPLPDAGADTAAHPLVTVGDSPALLVDGPYVPQQGDSIRSILSPRIVPAVRQILAASSSPAAKPSDGLEATRVEHAVAWMFGFCPSPLLTSPRPSKTDA